MEALFVILLALIGIVVKAKMRTPTSAPPPRPMPNRPVTYRTVHTAAAPSHTAAQAARQAQPSTPIASRLQPAMTSRLQSASYDPINEDCEDHVAYPEATPNEANVYEAQRAVEDSDPYGVFALDEDDAMRAFVLREVLDAPVSMRRRQPRT